MTAANAPAAIMEPGPHDVGHEGRCNSLKRDGSGDRCRLSAGAGTDHLGAGACKRHGGSTPSHAVAAGRVLAARRVGELLAEYGRDPATLDPHQEVLEVVALTAGMVRVYGLLVGELTAGPVVPVGDGGDAAEAAGGLWGADHKGDARPHEAVRALGEWSDRHLRACKTAADMGIDQRRIELAEGMARELADVLRVGMGELVEFVRREVDDAGLVRRLEAAVPGLLRGAIERAHVIDVHETKEA